MKKRMALFIGILCCFVLMAGAAFAEEPGAAATVNDGHVHITDCTMPNECYICHGTTELGITIEVIYHDYDWENRQYDAKEHWYTCSSCGEKYGISAHSANCDEPDICERCGKSVDDGIIIKEIFHEYDWKNYQYDSKEHWYTCSSCGETYIISTHWANCDEPDICAQCGKSVDDGIIIDDKEIYHEYDWENIQYDAKGHWLTCGRCGKKYELSAHFAYCDEPDTCVGCGKTVDDGIIIDDERINHNYDWKMDENKHWQECSLCGRIQNEGEHFIYCLKPGLCYRCYTPCELEVIHINNNLDDYHYYDETYHQFECEYGHGNILELHEFVDGKCKLCGYQPVTVVRGDANGDDSFALDDIMAMIDYYCGSGSIVSAACDLDNDGAACTLADIMVAIDLYCSM